jgi:protein-tyrosine phosphatase
MILDYLFCGNIYNAHNKKQLLELNIEYILSLRSGQGRLNNNNSTQCRYLHCPIDDFGSSNLEEIWMICFDFIQEAKLNQKKILVHCDGGINRAPTIVLGYLVSREQWHLRTALEHLVQVRPIVAPQASYIEQLRFLEFRIHGKDTLDGVFVKTQEILKVQREILLNQYREETHC